jgi:predicted lactoylglutathione lyase
MARAAAAGATIVKPAADTFYGGYAGYFQDPDGHLWEPVWNPPGKAVVRYTGRFEEPALESCTDG